MWICDRCETYNPDNISKCRVCGAEIPIFRVADAEDLITDHIEFGSLAEKKAGVMASSKNDQPFKASMGIDIMTETLETAKASASELPEKKEQAPDEQYAAARKKRALITASLIILNIALLIALVIFIMEML